MAKTKKRAVPADIWLDRATAAQVEKMKTALRLIPPVPPPVMVPGNAETAAAVKGLPHLVPVVDEALPNGERNVVWDALTLNAPRAYIVELCPPRGSVPAWRLLKCKVEAARIVSIEAGVENLRDMALRDIEDDILRDA